jgi:hypothetical protein
LTRHLANNQVGQAIKSIIATKKKLKLLSNRLEIETEKMNLTEVSTEAFIDGL